MSYNKYFELTPDDIDIIESSLGRELTRLTNNRLMLTSSTIKPESDIQGVKDIDIEIKKIRDLLGSLHNQKIWYRPKDRFVGGG